VPATLERQHLANRLRLLEAQVASLPLPRIAKQTKAPPLEPPDVSEALPQAAPPDAPRVRCETCRFYRPVAITAPIVHAIGAKGQCLYGPPTVPIANHAIDGATIPTSIEYEPRIVDANNPGCSEHPEFGRVDPPRD
jgi:hypothetical protein